MSNSKPLKVNYSCRAMPLAIEKLHLSEDQADIHFIVKAADGTFERVPAHKFLLMRMSSVFRAMFSGLWAERDEVEIVDASAAAFREFLQFFYFTDIKLTMENALGVVILVDKYDVDDSFITDMGDRETICAKFVMDNLTANEVCAAYELAISLEHQVGLEVSCEIFIVVNSIETFASEGFLKIARETVKSILEMDQLNCSESDVLKALLDWIKARLEPNDFTAENIRSQFGDLLHEIRFEHIPAEELASLSTSFTSDDLSKINQIIGSAEFNPTAISKNREKRQRIEDKHIVGRICVRSLAFGLSTPYYIKEKETTTFSVNNPCWLIWFGCFLRVYRDGNYFELENDLPCKITIVELESDDLSQPEKNEILHEQQAILPKDNDEILLSKAVLVRPGLLYKIEMEQIPPDNCCVGASIESFVQDVDLCVKFYNDPTVENEIRSVIRTLIFDIHTNQS